MKKTPKIRPDQILREFQVILALEEEAANAYSRLAEDCDDAEASEMLRRLAREELAHVAIAKELVRMAELWNSANTQ